MREVIVCALLVGSSCFLGAAEESNRQIQACLMTGELERAREFVREGKGDPYWQGRVWARLGATSQALELWRGHSFPPSLHNGLLEEICWGVLAKGAHSTSLSTRMTALIGAALSREARGVELLAQAFEDRNERIRQIAVELSGHYRDGVLTQKLLKELTPSSPPQLRQAVLHSLGAQRAKAALPSLRVLLRHPTLSHKEKNKCAFIIADLSEGVEEEELVSLSHSKRASERILACYLAWRFSPPFVEPLLFSLMKDPLPPVRCAAAEVYGLLKAEGSLSGREGVWFTLFQDVDPRLRALAGWGALLEGDLRGGFKLVELIEQGDRLSRLYGAWALAASGERGKELSLQLLEKELDEEVAINLALGLWGQGERERSKKIVKRFLLNEQKGWGVVREEGKVLKGIALQVGGRGGKEEEVQLQLLALLASEDEESGFQILERWLFHPRWDLAMEAAFLLLSEGSETPSFSLEKSQDWKEEQQVRWALILALWKRDSQALAFLVEAYRHASREVKEHLIEGVGRVGDPLALPLLVEALEEPFEGMNLMAASAILQLLSHQ